MGHIFFLALFKQYFTSINFTNTLTQFKTRGIFFSVLIKQTIPVSTLQALLLGQFAAIWPQPSQAQHCISPPVFVFGHGGTRNEHTCGVGLVDLVCWTDLSQAAADLLSLSYRLATSRSSAISAAVPAVLGLLSITHVHIPGGNVSKNCSRSIVSF